MADLTTGVDAVVEAFAEQDFEYDWTVAWADPGEEVISVKAAGKYALMEVEDVVLFMQGYGFHLGYAPGAGAPEAEFQFKRME